MAAPIYYRWDDANAPVARGERTSMIEILTACLVTGYGSKPPAGWTKQFVNAEGTKAVFRNDPVSGTGMVLLIDAATSNSNNVFYACGYEAASSVDDVVFPFYTAGSLPTQYISNQNNTQSRPWFLLTDERAFYFFCWYNQTTPPTKAQPATMAYYFGDIVCDSQDDAYGCGHILAGGGNGMSLTMRSASMQMDNLYGLHMPKRMSGSGHGVGHTVCPGGGPGSSDVPGRDGAPFVASRPIITRPHVNDAATYTFRGFLPGFWYPCHKQPYGQLEQLAIDGRVYLSVIAMLSGYTGSILLSLEDWRV